MAEIISPTLVATSPAGITDPSHYSPTAATDLSHNGSCSHHADQARPINLGGSFQLPGSSVAEARRIRCEQNETGVIKSAATSPAKHLQQLIRLDPVFEVARKISGVGYQNRAHGKIDPSRESHRRHDDIELACFGQGFDEPCAHGITQSAVMISDPLPQKFRQPLTGERFLL